MIITAGQAIVRVLASWDIKNIYGIPGSSVNGLMQGLNLEQDKVKYIQVRQEGAGAMAASAYGKFSGKIGVAFGSAGPGGTNLMNGLYDAKHDGVPLLALVGQSATANLNTTYFQEIEELPIYSDVSVFNKMVSNAEQIPDVVDEAIRAAYAKKGVAVVILPNDLVEQVIDYNPRKSARIISSDIQYHINSSDISEALKMIKEAKNPVLYVGLGLRGSKDLVAKVSEKFKMPIVSSAPSIGVAINSDHPNYMGAWGRLGTKASYDVMDNADLILFVGSNMPFARFWKNEIRVIQVNTNPEDIGKQLEVDLGILTDGKTFLSELLKTDYSVDKRIFLDAARISKKNWEEWLDSLAKDKSLGLTPEAVLKEVKKLATDDAFFGVDVGNNSMHSVRLLPFDKNQQFTLSGWFATMGVGLPSAIAAQVTDRDRQVWSISGDGGYSMNMQEMVTQTKYQLPIINVVLTDQSYGFIQHAQIQSEFLYGVDIQDADWAMTARGMGAIAFTITNHKELESVFKQVEELIKSNENKRPIFIEAKYMYHDPIDTSDMKLDPTKYSKEEIDEYKKTYNIYGQPSLPEIIDNL